MRHYVQIDAGWGSSMLLTALLLPATEGGFTATNPETGTTSQGESVEEAINNLREATALFLEEFPQREFGHPLITTFEVAEHSNIGTHEN